MFVAVEEVEGGLVGEELTVTVVKVEIMEMVRQERMVL
jgi:hypothetical protein